MEKVTKRRIGFDPTTMCDCAKKGSSNCEEEHNTEHSCGPGDIPEHIVNEIESHINAKNEFEHQMSRLARFELVTKIGLYVIGFIVILAAIGASFYYGRYYERKQIRTKTELTEKIKMVYRKGLADGKIGRNRLEENKSQSK